MKLTITDKKRILDYIRVQDPKNSILTITPSKDFFRADIVYSSKIVQHREIKTISGDEEWVRAFLIIRLVNYGYN